MAATTSDCATFCNPNYYIEAMKHKYPDVFNEWCCNELSHVLDFNGADGIGQILSGEIEPKHFKKSSKTSKHRKVPVTGIFGAPLTEEGFCQIRQLIEHLKKFLQVEGIFRIPGNAERQRKLKEKINGGVTFDLDVDIFTHHDVACVMKGFLGELPEPLLTDKQYLAHVQAAGLTYKLEERLEDRGSGAQQLVKLSQGQAQQVRDKRRGDHLAALTHLLLLLPTTNYKLLQELLDLLHLVSAQQAINRMTATNLGMMFAPHVLWPRYFTTEDVRDQDFVNKLNYGMEFMIEHSQTIFQIPSKLQTQCEMYVKQGQKRHLEATSQQSQPEEVKAKVAVLAKGGMARPVIGRPEAASIRLEGANQTTQQALDRLYTQVQAMPPSAKKRKLMKNFVKNSYLPGTPTRILNVAKEEMSGAYGRGKKHSRSRSFGGVIKKHMLGSRKKAAAASTEEAAAAALHPRVDTPLSPLNNRRIVPTIKQPMLLNSGGCPPLNFNNCGNAIDQENACKVVDMLTHSAADCQTPKGSQVRAIPFIDADTPLRVSPRARTRNRSADDILCASSVNSHSVIV